ncbi:MAG TPA: preprotein translocase subunit YajC [Terriglobales bacterium]|jgi:preprotein translocase subunit YajC|nr:preprotein translocase subunit YajC [Terriglobales bacterium]
MYIFGLFLFQTSSPSGAGGLSGLVLFLPLILLFGYMFYSQQRRQKKWQATLGELKTGDKVVTSGGLRGTIVALKDDALHLRVPPDNLRIEITRASVVSVTTPDEAVTK